MPDISSKTTAPAEAKPETKPGEPLLVIDIGKKQSKRRIRQLREGRGRLFDKIADTVAGLRSEGAIKDNVQPLVIVVRKKPRKTLGF